MIRVLGQDTKWERSLAVHRLGEHTAGVQHGIAQEKPLRCSATGSLLCNPMISLSERVQA